MTFEVPASAASQKQNTFEFKVPGERKARSLPKLQFVPMGFRDRIGKAAKPIQAAEDAGRKPTEGELEALGLIQLELLDKFSPGLTDLLDENQLSALLVAWGDASAVSLGE